jgi:putative SOS response-associated peptidase YedK
MSPPDWHAIFALAGIWRKEDGQPRYAFLTTAPNALIAVVHPKAMPVILEENSYDRWLTGDWDDACQLVAAYPSQLMAQR